MNVFNGVRNGSFVSSLAIVFTTMSYNTLSPMMYWLCIVRYAVLRMQMSRWRATFNHTKYIQGTVVYYIHIHAKLRSCMYKLGALHKTRWQHCALVAWIIDRMLSSACVFVSCEMVSTLYARDSLSLSVFLSYADACFCICIIDGVVHETQVHRQTHANRVRRDVAFIQIINGLLFF